MKAELKRGRGRPKSFDLIAFLRANPEALAWKKPAIAAKLKKPVGSVNSQLRLASKAGLIRRVSVLQFVHNEPKNMTYNYQKTMLSLPAGSIVFQNGALMCNNDSQFGYIQHIGEYIRTHIPEGTTQIIIVLNGKANILNAQDLSARSINALLLEMTIGENLSELAITVIANISTNVSIAETKNQ